LVGRLFIPSATLHFDTLSDQLTNGYEDTALGAKTQENLTALPHKRRERIEASVEE
jgi:hypothetical protein